MLNLASLKFQLSGSHFKTAPGRTFQFPFFSCSLLLILCLISPYWSSGDNSCVGEIIRITLTYGATHKHSVCINVVFFFVVVVVVFLDSAARSGVIQVLNVTEVIDCFI